MNWTLAIPFLVLAGGNFAWGEARKSETTAATWRYFRFDGGVASPGCGPLPDKFDMPGGLRWKAPMDPGQSSPIVANGRIFLTTYGAEAKELATVALDLATGKTMWKRVVPVSRIETFHPQMGSAAVATPAWDGARLFVFFGSYGLIGYDFEGRTLWEHALGPFRDEYGAGSSPHANRRQGGALPGP